MLPREAFLARFGPVLLTRLDQLMGRLDEPVPAAAAERQFAARWSAEYPTLRRETIEGVLEHLSARVAAALDRCGWGALRLECGLTLEGGGQREGDRETEGQGETETRKFPPPAVNRSSPRLPLSLSPPLLVSPSPVSLFRPTATAEHWLELLRLSLDRLRIVLPVAAICLTATQTAPLEPRRQTSLFDFDGRELARRRSRDLTALVERLSSRLGRQAVVRVRLRPEAQPELSWREDPWIGARRRGTGKASGTRLPPRPLRLLPRPRLRGISADSGHRRWNRRDNFVLPASSTALPGTGGRSGLKPVGGAVNRQAAITSASKRPPASRYWLFRRLRDGKWFLHGTFE